MRSLRAEGCFEVLKGYVLGVVLTVLANATKLIVLFKGLGVRV